MSKMNITLYLPNKPDLLEYTSKRGLSALKSGEVQSIISQTGNHWRKIFSIYAKISFGLNNQVAKTWQEFRDDILLTSKSNTKISFASKISKADIHIISGMACVEKFNLDMKHFKKLDTEGKILYHKNIYLTPYFDYRQFPNTLIEILNTNLSIKRHH